MINGLRVIANHFMKMHENAIHFRLKKLRIFQMNVKNL